MLKNSLPRLEQGQTERGRIRGPAGALEYRLEMPRQSTLGLAVICHPHPLYQGTMDNKVVYTLSRAALAQGCMALRFQFRGVGDSDGPHDNGRGEAEDTMFLFDQLRDTWPRLPAFLMGFSFGSYMALKAASEREVDGLVAVAPPLLYAGSDPQPEPNCPWLVLHGTDDDVVPWTETAARLEGMSNQPERVTFDGAGHFFHGRLGELREAIEPWLERQIAAH